MDYFVLEKVFFLLLELVYELRLINVVLHVLSSVVLIDLGDVDIDVDEVQDELLSFVGDHQQGLWVTLHLRHEVQFVWGSLIEETILNELDVYVLGLTALVRGY